jgi:phosphoglycerol transferase
LQSSSKLAAAEPRTRFELLQLHRHRSRLISELKGATISASLALAGAVAVLRLWRANLNVPISPAVSDTLPQLMLVKNIQTTGWFQGTPELGAPFGQDLTGFPGWVGDTWNLLTLKALGTFMSPAGTVNVMFILGFPVIAAVAYCCLRLLRVSPPIACTLGAVYAWLPYHFLRSEGHLFLSSYYALPVACVLAVSIVNGRLALLVNPGRMPRKTWGAIAGTVLLAGTGLYYAAFAIVLLLAAGLLGSLAMRKWGPLLSGSVLASLMGLGLTLAALPNLLRTVPFGSDTSGEGRSYLATELYGLKFTNLLLPVAGHRIPALAHLRTATAQTLIPGEGGTETLGILGAIGLTAVIVAVLLPARGRNSVLIRQLHPLGTMAIVSLLFGTVAGLNSLLAVFGFGALRAWNRISVLVGFLALVGLGHLLDAGRARWGGRTLIVRRVVATAGAGLVLVVGLYDQTSPSMIPDYASTTASWQSDEAYFARVQNDLGQGASVFALPYMPFPESWPIVKMTDYSHLRGYMHSDLRWNYGGLKNEASEWQPIALQGGIAPALPKLVVAGFDALYINRLGYADSGAKIESEIIAAIGPQRPLVNADATLAVYDLRAYAKNLESTSTRLPSRASVLQPVPVKYGIGFYSEETNGTNRWHWAGGSAQMTLINPTGEARKVVLHGTVHVADSTAAVWVRVGGHETRLQPAKGLANLDIHTTIQQGPTPVQIITDSSATQPTPKVIDNRDLRQQLIDFAVIPEEGIR